MQSNEGVLHRFLPAGEHSEYSSISRSASQFETQRIKHSSIHHQSVAFFEMEFSYRGIDLPLFHISPRTLLHRFGSGRMIILRSALSAFCRFCCGVNSRMAE